MNIALIDRIESKNLPGGDTIQINEIAKYLKNIGYRVQILNELYPELSNFNVAFIFNMTRYYDCLISAVACINQKKPYILFPIYWDMDSLAIPPYDITSFIKSKVPSVVNDRLRQYRSNLKNEKIKDLIKEYNYLVTSKKKIKEFILNNASYICPNSYAELNHLEERFTIKNADKIKVIYNGIQKNLFNKSLDAMKNRDFICVGAVGPRKNQLNLAKSSLQTGINIKIIGQNSTADSNYMKQVKKHGKYLEFLGWKPHREVLQFMTRSYVHIQPSFIETPGIASMEAYTMGCKLILSDVEPVKEYFGEDVFYVNPRCIKSISEALIEVKNDFKYRLDYKKIKDFNDKFSWCNVLQDLKGILATI